MRRIALVLATATVVALAMATLAGCDQSFKITRPGLVPSSVPPAISSVPLGARTRAELRVISGFATITIGTSVGGGDLVQATAGAGSRGTPVASVQGDTVSIANAAPTGGNDGVQIELNPTVLWTIALDGGATSAAIDLSAARVTAVDLDQGVSTLDLTLATSSGTTQVAIAAGVSSALVHVHGAAAVRASLSAGAGTVVVDGVTHSGVAGGSSFTPGDWDTAADRVDVECSAGVGSLVVDRI